MQHGGLLAPVRGPGVGNPDDWLYIGESGEFKATTAGVPEPNVNDREPGDKEGNSKSSSISVRRIGTYSRLGRVILWNSKMWV